MPRLRAAMQVNHHVDHESQVTVFAYPGDRNVDAVVKAITESGHRFKGREVLMRCHVMDQVTDKTAHIVAKGAEDGNHVRISISDHEGHAEQELLATAERTSTWHEAAQYELNVAANVDVSLMVLLAIIWIVRPPRRSAPCLCSLNAVYSIRMPSVCCSC